MRYYLKQLSFQLIDTDWIVLFIIRRYEMASKWFCISIF